MSESLHVEEHAGREPATVWLHHGVGSTRAWDPFLPALAGGRRAVVYDRGGFGRSPRGRGFTTRLFEEDVDDLRSLLTSRASGRVHLVGHSDGGTVALLLAAREPDLVTSVAVISVHVRGDPVTVATLRRMGPPAQWPEPMRRSLARAHGEDWTDVAGRWHALWVSPEWASWSIVEELAAVRRPVLAVHGTRDDLAPPFHADLVRAAIPGTRVLWVDTATHEPHRADPQGFGAALETLWDEAESAMGQRDG